MRVLEIETEHTGPFKTLVEVLKEMLPEANIQFIMDPNANKSNEGDDEENKEGENKRDISGMRITAIDITKTVFINLKLEAKNFSKFMCKKPKLTLGVNLLYLHKLIKSIDKEDNLTLYQDIDNKNLLNIKVNNPESGKETYFDLKLLEIKKEKIKIPNITCEAQVTINSQEFHKLCREMNQIANFVDIRCLKNRVEFTCKGDNANRKTVYRTDEEGGANKVHIQYDTKDDGKPFIVQGIYELKNLVMFAKCASLCEKIEIFLKSNYPLVIRYTVATLGRLIICLSPVKEETIRNANFEDDEEYYSD